MSLSRFILISLSYLQSNINTCSHFDVLVAPVAMSETLVVVQIQLGVYACVHPSGFVRAITSTFA